MTLIIMTFTIGTLNIDTSHNDTRHDSSKITLSMVSAHSPGIIKLSFMTLSGMETSIIILNIMMPILKTLRLMTLSVKVLNIVTAS